MQVQQNKDKSQNARFIHRGSETPVADCYKTGVFPLEFFTVAVMQASCDPALWLSLF
jgi:hypothetical protein